MNKSVIEKFDNLYKRVMERKESKVVEIIDGCKIVGTMAPTKDPLGLTDTIYFWGFDYYRKTEKGCWKLMCKCGLMGDWTVEHNGTEDLVRHLKYQMFDWFYSPLIRLGEEEKKTWIRLFGSNGKEWNNQVRRIQKSVESLGMKFTPEFLAIS